MKKFIKDLVYSDSSGILFTLYYRTRYLFKSPSQWVQELWRDIESDRKASLFNSPHNIVWCAGLPKSGTTMIEEIFEYLPYVRASDSTLRRFSRGQLDHPHGVSDGMFKNLPKDKYSFLKTHTHFTKEYFDIALKYNARVIVSIRDLRDVMISRYYHVMAQNDHWEHSHISALSEKEGFLKSLTCTEGLHNDVEPIVEPIVYYYNWIVGWKEASLSQDICLCEYEKYKNDPLEYISEVLDWIGFSSFSSALIEEGLDGIRLKAEALPLEEQLIKARRSITTYRKGKIGAHVDFFDDEIESRFSELLPGSGERVFWKPDPEINLA